MLHNLLLLLPPLLLLLVFPLAACLGCWRMSDALLESCPAMTCCCCCCCCRFLTSLVNLGICDSPEAGKKLIERRGAGGAPPTHFAMRYVRASLIKCHCMQYHCNCYVTHVVQHAAPCDNTSLCAVVEVYWAQRVIITCWISLAAEPQLPKLLLLLVVRLLRLLTSVGCCCRCTSLNKW